MEWVETTGRSVAEAKDRALDQLGVDESDAEFKVIAEPKTSIFGRLKTEARIQARVKPSVPRSKEQANRKRRRGPKDRRPESTGEGEPATSNSPAVADPKDAGERSNQRKRKPQNRNRRPAAQRAVEETNEGATKVSEETVSLDEQGTVAEDFLGGFFDEIGIAMATELAIDEEEELVKINITGDNLGHMIGPRGATLHSLQEITRTVVQRKTGSRTGRIVLDIAGYREKRKAALASFTRQVSQQVIDSGSSRNLEPMNPPDRKIVHDVVVEISGVTTASEGEEPKRYVVIKPD